MDSLPSVKGLTSVDNLNSVIEREPVAFPLEAAAVLRQLRAQISSLFEGIPGGVRKSRDVQKVLGVDARLSWQIFKLAAPGDPMALAPHVPTAASMRRLLTAAKDHGVAEDKVEGVRKAFEAFENLVETHAGDRTSFDTMARGFSDDENGAQTDIMHRKTIFQGHSHFYGAQTQTLVITQIVHPGKAPGLYDVAHIRSRLGQRRLRPDADIVVDTVRVTSPNGTAGGLHWDLVDEPASDTYHAPILPAFCTQPLPELRTTQHDDGTIVTELVGDAVGRRSAVDMVFSQILRDVPLTPMMPGTNKLGFGGQVAIVTPTTLLIFDMIIHQPTFQKLALELSVMAYGSAPALHTGHPSLKLPFSERVVAMGMGSDAVLTREVPRYLELVQYICDRMGWRLEDMAIYRARIEYPMLDTLPTITAEVHS